MMNIKKILTNPKGVDWNLRQITIVFRFAQTIVAFANDAGGDLNIGVMYDLREVVELDLSLLFRWILPVKLAS